MLDSVNDIFYSVIIGIGAAVIGYVSHLLKTYFFKEKEDFKEDVKEIRKDFHHLEDRFEEMASTVESRLGDMFKLTDTKFDGLASMMTELTNKWSEYVVHSTYTKEKVDKIGERVDVLEQKLEDFVKNKRHKTK